MSTKAVAVRRDTDLSIRADQDMFDAKQLAALKQLGMQDASNADLAVFFHQAVRTGLDPFARQIYMIGRRAKTREGGWETKQTIQTGIDGYRLVARRAADARHETLGYDDTLWCDHEGIWSSVWLGKGNPVAAKVTVRRNGEAFPAVAHWSEYVQTDRDGTPNPMWSRMGANQLAKCAEALALRKAFPQDLAGVYINDEIRDDEPPAKTKPSLRAAVHAVVDEPTADPEVIDAEVVSEPPAVPRITDRQSKRLHAMVNEAGMDRGAKLAYCRIAIGRPITTTSDLSTDEAGLVLDLLKDGVRFDAPTPDPESAA